MAEGSAPTDKKPNPTRAAPANGTAAAPKSRKRLNQDKNDVDSHNITEETHRTAASSPDTSDGLMREYEEPVVPQHQYDAAAIHSTSPSIRPPRIFRRRRHKRRHKYTITNSFSDDDQYPKTATVEFNDDDDTFTGNWSLEDDVASPHNIDLDVCQQLDLEYDRALEDRHIAWTARYQSVRQSTVLSIFCTIFLIFTGTAFYYKQAEPYWTVPEALLFTIYTVTTVGYGHLEMPDSAVFHLYTVVFIFLGTAMLTILVAQVYQCISLEATRVAVSGTHETRRWRSWLEQHSSGLAQNHRPEEPTWVEIGLKWYDAVAAFLKEDEFGKAIAVVLPFVSLISIGALIVGPLEGWSISEAIYFSTISLTTVGYVRSVFDSYKFSHNPLLQGDYYPTGTLSIWFCIFWLPFSVVFMSLHLSQVAKFYINLSDNNVQRIETVLRRQLQISKERAAAERNVILQRAMRGQGSSDSLQDHHPSTIEVGPLPKSPVEELRITETDSDEFETIDGAGQSLGDLQLTDETKRRPRGNRQRDGFQSLQQPDQREHQREHHTRRAPLFGSAGCVEMNRREHILRAHKNSSSKRWTTMKDLLESVHNAIEEGSSNDEYLTLRSRPVLRGGVVRHQPSLALRAILLERFAEIIAVDIAGYQSAIEIKEYTLSVTILSLKQTADKWEVPRRARKAFRAVAFEAVWCVGDHRLITQGVDALLALTPSEFHQIFSPLLAAFGDAETMELWLAHTQALADVDLKQATSRDDDDDGWYNQKGGMRERGESNVHRRRGSNDDAYPQSQITNLSEGVTVSEEEPDSNPPTDAAGEEVGTNPKNTDATVPTVPELS